MNLTIFCTNKNSLVLNVSMHTHQIIFMRNTNDQSQTASMTDSENFISWGWINTVAQWVIWKVHNFILMSFNTNNIFITILCHNNNVNNTIIKTYSDSFRGGIIRDTKNFLRISFRPFFDKFWGSFFSLPSLETTNFHEFTSFIFPRKFGIGYFSVKFWSRAHISSSDEKNLLWLNKDIVSDTFCFSFDIKLKFELRRIEYDIRCVFIKLKERLNKLWIYKIISDDNFSQKVFKTYFSVFKIFVFHFKKERFSREVGEIMIRVFKSFPEVIKLWESFFEIPFVVSALNFDGEVDGIFFCFVFFVASNGDFDGGGQIVVG